MVTKVIIYLRINKIKENYTIIQRVFKSAISVSFNDLIEAENLWV